MGTKVLRLTTALTAPDLIVGEPGPAQRLLIDRYQSANDEDRAELRRMWAIALMKAQGVDWLTIARALQTEDPSRYQSRLLWRDVYEAAEEATLGEAASDAIAALRRLTRAKSEYVRVQAGKALLDARAKQWKQRTETHVEVHDDTPPELQALLAALKAMPPDDLRAILATPAQVVTHDGPANTDPVASGDNPRRELLS